MNIFNGPPRKPGSKSDYGSIKFTNRGNGQAEILIYGDIGDDWFGGVTAKDFAEELKGLGNVKSVNVRINSVGGSVFDGVAIYNTLLNSSAEITVDIDGAALSIASIIAMAGDQVRMADNGFFMIHEPHGIFAGDAEQLRKQADTLDIVRGQLINTYSNRRGIDAGKVEDWLKAETWFDSTGALDAGFVDEVTGAVEIAAHYDLSQFKNAPKALKNQKNVIQIPQSGIKSSASAALTRMKTSLKARKIK